MCRRSFCPVVLSVAMLALAQPQAQSQPAKPSSETALFRGLQYRLVGPSRGGRVTTVTGVPSQPSTFYMGVASGGVFRTTDGGATWVPITDGKVPVGSIGAIAVADSDPNIIYVGTGSDGVRSNVSTGRGVYKIDRRRRDLAVRRPLQRRPDRRRAHPSDQSRHRLGRRPTATSSSRTPSAASSRRPTAARPGRRCCSSPTASARWTSSCSPATRTSSTRGCRASSASRGRSSAARARAASTRAPTAARRSRRSRPACRTS